MVAYEQQRGKGLHFCAEDRDGEFKDKKQI